MKATIRILILLSIGFSPLIFLINKTTPYNIRAENANAARVRSCPNLTCPVSETLKNGTSIEVYDTVRGSGIGGNSFWFRIRFETESGFIHSSLAVINSDKAMLFNIVPFISVVFAFLAWLALLAIALVFIFERSPDQPTDTQPAPSPLESKGASWRRNEGKEYEVWTPEGAAKRLKRYIRKPNATTIRKWQWLAKQEDHPEAAKIAQECLDYQDNDYTFYG